MYSNVGIINQNRVGVCGRSKNAHGIQIFPVREATRAALSCFCHAELVSASKMKKNTHTDYTDFTDFRNKKGIDPCC
jgi:hypothetical protein